jgi:hypothetical protein
VTARPLDLGGGCKLWFTVWDPDLGLNPELAQYAGQLPVTIGGIFGHPLRPGDPIAFCHDLGYCASSLTFDVPMAAVFGARAVWQVESWEPLTLSPSVGCHCGEHGYIRSGTWVHVP